MVIWGLVTQFAKDWEKAQFGGNRRFGFQGFITKNGVCTTHEKKTFGPLTCGRVWLPLRLNRAKRKEKLNNGEQVDTWVDFGLRVSSKNTYSRERHVEAVKEDAEGQAGGNWRKGEGDGTKEGRVHTGEPQLIGGLRRKKKVTEKVRRGGEVVRLGGPAGIMVENGGLSTNKKGLALIPREGSCTKAKLRGAHRDCRTDCFYKRR